MGSRRFLANAYSLGSLGPRFSNPLIGEQNDILRVYDGPGLIAHVVVRGDFWNPGLSFPAPSPQPLVPWRIANVLSVR